MYLLTYLLTDFLIYTCYLPEKKLVLIDGVDVGVGRIYINYYINYLLT